MPVNSDSKDGSHPSSNDRKWSGAFLKMVGAITAAVSLLLGLNQITGLVQDLRIHHKEFSDAMQSGEQQQQRGDYGTAFRSFKHAVELDPIDRNAQTRATQTAMLWLENAHAHQNQSFTDIANQSLPVLDNSLSRARGSAAADIWAHIAWANFFKYRDGIREGVNIDENLKAAFAADSHNVYAYAITGFWILWQGGKLDVAKPHFAAALATGRVRAYVRNLQIAALINAASPETEAEQLRVANEMRQSGELMAAHEKQRIFWNNFSSKFHSRDRLVSALSVLPPSETEATYDWLDSDRETDAVKIESRAFVMANLKEITGHQAEALSEFRSLQKRLQGTNSALVPQVDEAIKRLLRPH